MVKLGTVTVFGVTMRIEHLMVYAAAVGLIYASTVYSCKRITVAEGFQLMGAVLDGRAPIIPRENGEGKGKAAVAGAGADAGEDADTDAGGVEGFAQRDRGNWLARLSKTDLSSFYKS
jgi:hypothetical protein